MATELRSETHMTWTREALNAAKHAADELGMAASIDIATLAEATAEAAGLDEVTLKAWSLARESMTAQAEAKRLRAEAATIRENVEHLRASAGRMAYQLDQALSYRPEAREAWERTLVAIAPAQLAYMAGEIAKYEAQADEMVARASRLAEGGR